MPPLCHNAGGEERRCGVEIEYTGISLAHAANMIARLWHGRIDCKHTHHIVVHTDHGNFSVELDVAWMRKLSEQAEADRALEQFPLAETADKMLAPFVEAIAPHEIITPPLPFSRLHELDILVERLREAGAKGTSDSVIYAFGVHLNPELPALDAGTITHYLQAFLLLYEWMKHAMQVDATRILTGFARGFPMDYMRLVLSLDYHPDMNRLIDDYLYYNPTRNRALDMLPLFTCIDEKRVRAVVTDTLVKARPTFHFRLPNCHIDHTDWTLTEAWHYWLEVEKLACDTDRLRNMRAAWIECHDSPLYLLDNRWREETHQWLHPAHG